MSRDSEQEEESAFLTERSDWLMDADMTCSDLLLAGRLLSAASDWLNGPRVVNNALLLFVFVTAPGSAPQTQTHQCDRLLISCQSCVSVLIDS